MAENAAPESTETLLRKIESDLKYWRDEVLIMDYQEQPMRWLISEVRRLNAHINKPRADRAAPDAARWSDTFPVDQQGYYWIQLVSSPDNNVIGFISRNLIHYTNGEKERGELCGKKYKFLGPLQPTDAVRQTRRQGFLDAANIAEAMAAGETYETGRQKALNIAAAIRAEGKGETP